MVTSKQTKKKGCNYNCNEKDEENIHTLCISLQILAISSCYSLDLKCPPLLSFMGLAGDRIRRTLCSSVGPAEHSVRKLAWLDLDRYILGQWSFLLSLFPGFHELNSFSLPFPSLPLPFLPWTKPWIKINCGQQYFVLTMRK